MLAAIIGTFCAEFDEKLAVPAVYGFVSTAEAVVGRPLSPVCRWLIARRTARR